MTAETKLFRANEDVVVCDLGEGLALLNLETSTYYSLNAVAAAAWEALQRPITHEQLTDNICRKFDVARPTCVGDMNKLLENLSEARLVRAEER